MQEKSLLKWGLTAVLALSMTMAMAARPEPNAFLNRKAATTAELVNQAQSDPQVMDRYRRHFGMTSEEVIEMLRSLHVAKLNSSGTYMIYSVDEQSGVIKSTAQHLKSGTKVFADASGNPVLKLNCGNALITGSDNQTASINPSMPTMNDQSREVAITTPLGSELTSIPTATALTPGEPLAVTPVMPQITTGSSNQGFAIPAVLAALGGGAAFLVGGGHSNPVPEPASMVVIGGAIAAMAARRRKR